MKATSIAQVNKAIQKVYPNVCIFKSEGTFFLYSDDDQTQNMLSMWVQSSIEVCHLNQLTVEQWVESVESLAQDKDNTEGYDIIRLN
jgi:hypothetical protein